MIMFVVIVLRIRHLGTNSKTETTMNPGIGVYPRAVFKSCTDTIYRELILNFTGILYCSLYPKMGLRSSLEKLCTSFISEFGFCISRTKLMGGGLEAPLHF